MRSIRPEVLAEATKHGSKPYLQVGFADTRFRWSSLYAGDGSRYYTAVATIGTTIHRARVDGAGNVQTATVTNPQTYSQWTTWTTRATGASPITDVAMCAAPPNNTLTIFYIKPGYHIAAIESNDGGNTWSSLGNIITSLATKPYIAAAGTDFQTRLTLFYTDGGSVQVARYNSGTGTWTLGTPLLSGVTNFYGLAAFYLNDEEIKVLAAADGRLYYAVYNYQADSWTDPAQIAPGGHAAPAAGLTIRYPAIYTLGEAPGHTIATWLEHYDDGSNAWDNTVVCRSIDCTHWGEDVTLYIWGDRELRTALCFLGESKVLYAANEKCVCTHKVYHPEDTTQNLTLTPLEYHRETDAHRSTINLVFANPTELYNAIGQAGTVGECIKPHTRVVVSRGYIIPTVPPEYMNLTTEPLDPHYITRAEVRAALDDYRLYITAVNGWGLLDRWRPTETLTYKERPIAWLLAEFCAKVGLGYADDGHDVFQRVITTFTVRTEISAAEACRQLLRLAGAVCRWDPGDSEREGAEGLMYAIYLADYAPTEHIDITKPLVLAGRYTVQPNTFTSQSTFSNQIASNLNLGQESMALGMRIHQMYTDYRIADLSHAIDVQVGIWDMGRRSGRNETITVPLRPDVDLWDTAHLQINPTIIPPADSLRTVVGLGEEYRRAPLRYVSRVGLWGR